MKLVVTEYADADLGQILRFYEPLQPGLFERLLQETDRIFQQLEQFPASYELTAHRLRRVQLSTVPYQLYYAESGDRIPVLGFVSARLHPKTKTKIVSKRLETWKQSGE